MGWGSTDRYKDITGKTIYGQASANLNTCGFCVHGQKLKRDNYQYKAFYFRYFIYGCPDANLH